MAAVWLAYAAVIVLAFPAFLTAIVPFALTVYADVGEPRLYVLLRPYTHRLFGAAVGISALTLAVVLLRLGELAG